MPDYEAMDDAELEAANQELQAQRVAIGEEQDALVAVRDKRSAEAAAAVILEGLSPGELDVLISAATAAIESKAAEAEITEEEEG